MTAALRLLCDPCHHNTPDVWMHRTERHAKTRCDRHPRRRALWVAEPGKIITFATDGTAAPADDLPW